MPKQLSIETRQKISAAHTGKKRSFEARHSMRLAHLGKELSLRHIEARSAGQRGLKRNAETKRRIGAATSAALRGRKLSPAHRAKIAAARVDYMMKHPWAGVSASETCFLDEIERTFGVVVERQFHLGGRIYDGRLGAKLIEVDGEYWHKEKTDVDLLKEKIAEDFGFKVYRFIVNDSKEVTKRIVEYFETIAKIVEFDD